MKRTLLTLLAAVVLGAGIDLAHAGSWKYQEIKWQLTSQGSPTSGTAIWQRDTSFAALGDAVDDSTEWFNIQIADPPLAFNGAVTDTLVLGYLVFSSDTTVTHGTTTTGMTVALQFAPKSTTSTLLNSTTAQTAQVTMTSGDKVAVFPIHIVQRGHSGPGIDLLNLGAVCSDFQLRGLVTGVAGGGFPMARAYVVYYDRDE